jgi:hypothetical protein
MHMDSTHGIENLIVGLKCELRRLCVEKAPGENLLDPDVEIGSLIQGVCRR